MSTVLPATVTDTVELPPPAWHPGSSLQRALAARHSTRRFRPEGLPLQTLSSLLWAAFGINRPDSGGRTAPSAHDWQEIDVHVVLADAAYRYEAASHRLLLSRRGDLRGHTGQQDFVATAPVNLVYVADYERMTEAEADECEFLSAVDAGCIAQNVYLSCAAFGLGTVVRGLIDRRTLAHALGLAPTQRILLAQSVGFAAA